MSTLSHFRCLGCGDVLPAWRGSWCDACIEWNDPPDAPYPPQGDEDNPDPDPAPGMTGQGGDLARGLGVKSTQHQTALHY